MLTLILLVVFGGGGGLLAIWLIDPDSLTPLVKRLKSVSLRGDRSRGTTPTEPAPEPAAEPVPALAGALIAPTGADLVRAPAGPPRGRRSTKVPSAFTAVEGTYRDVARVPAWRKATSLVLIVVVLIVTGIALAAVLAGGLAVAAGLLDRAIG